MKIQSEHKKYPLPFLRQVSEPFFSVIITTYNRASLLTRALDSLISQTEKDWEAIIVDDGSNDETYCMIIPYLRSYRKIIYIRQSNRGSASAKNLGIRSAKGSFITFLDSDDEFRPHHLEARKEVLTENPSVKFLYGGSKIIGNQYVPDRFNLNKMISLDECVIGGTFCIERNTALILNGFRDFALGCDADLFERAQRNNIIMLEVDHPTYIYHHETTDSITNRLSESL